MRPSDQTPATPAPLAAVRPAPAPDTGDSARTTVDGLANESFGGFASGSGIEIRVSGSRTVGLFILPGAQANIDNAAIRASLSDSAIREGRSFARVTDLQVMDERPAAADRIPEFSDADRKRFAEMELVGASLVDTSIASRHWLVVQAAAETYTPGSTVFLVVTSTPLVIGAARVGADGAAVITGAAPLELLGGGAHRLRVVGSRDFGTVTVNAQGGMQIPPATLAEIQLFDQETTAVVELIGLQPDGGARQLVRYIPLHEDPPYWMLLVPLDLVLLSLYLRRRRRLEPVRSKSLMAGILGVSAAVVSYVAWTMRYPEIAAASVLLLVLGLLTLAPLQVLRRRLLPAR